MKRNRLLAAATLAAGLVACKGSGYWMDRLDDNPARRRADEVRRGAACAKVIPIEHGRSLPVPVPVHGASRLAVLFYPAASEPGHSSVLSPSAKAEFSLDGPEADRCAKLDGGGARALGAGAPEGLSMAAYYRAQLAIYESLPRTAALYARGGDPGAEGRKSLQAYANGFLKAAEPGLRAEYYRLNPGFWEWLRKETGRSLPAPSVR